MEEENNQEEPQQEEPVVEEVRQEPVEEPKEKKKFGLFKKKPKEEVHDHKEHHVKEHPKVKKPLFKSKPKEPGQPGRVKGKINQWRRTLEVARKPSKDEFKLSAKITGVGILLLGLIGFIIFMIYHIIA